MGIGFWVAAISLAIFISNVMRLDWFVASIAAYVTCFVLLTIVNQIISRVQKLIEPYIRCAHGITGGLTRDRCMTCRLERIRREQAKAERQAEQAEKQRIQEAALKLSKQELERISKKKLQRLGGLTSLTPQKFEDTIAELFRDLGYSVQQTPYSNDFGRDAIATKDGKKYLIECKRYEQSRSVGRPELQKFHSAIIDDKADTGLFVTTGKFTDTAYRFAEDKNMELINGEALINYFREAYPGDGSESRIEVMCPSCGSLFNYEINPSSDVSSCPQGHEVKISSEFFSANSAATSPRCPTCGKEMRLINGRRGKFWGCTGYPVCRGTRPFQPVDIRSSLVRRQ